MVLPVTQTHIEECEKDISLQAYRATIGIFNGHLRSGKQYFIPNKLFFKKPNHNFEFAFRDWINVLNDRKLHAHDTKSHKLCGNIIAIAIITSLLLCLANDVEKNPGPAQNHCDILVCHANLRSLKSKGKILNINNLQENLI